MKPEEYRAMSDEQLSLALKDTIKNLFHLRFQSATERLETPSEIRKARREVARIRTVQRQRDLEAMKKLSPEQLAQKRKDLEQKMGQAQYSRGRRKVRAEVYRLQDTQRAQELASYQTQTKEQLTAKLGDLKKQMDKSNHESEKLKLFKEQVTIKNIMRRRGLLAPKPKENKIRGKKGQAGQASGS